MNIPRPKLLTSLLGGLVFAALTGQAATIISNPTTEQSVSIRDGLSTTFTVEATSTEGHQLLYQWFKGSVQLANGSGISGATTKTLKISGAKAENEGAYYAKVVERIGGNPDSQISENFTLTVLVRPKIATQPLASTVVNQGEGVSLSVELTPDTTMTGVTYQWQKNNVDIPGATNASFEIPAATPGNETTEGAQWQDAGSYRVKITSVLPTLPTPTETILFSKPGVLKVNSQPVILVQPAAATGGTLYVAEKATGKLSVLAGGNPKLVYEWQKQEGGVFSDAVVGKASSLPVKEEGTYRVKVTNGLTPAGGGTFSNPAEVVILKKPTESAPITVESNKTPNAKGEYLVENEGEIPPFVKLTVNPSLDNTGDLEFQWQKDGKNISDGDGISGSQSAVLTLEPLSWLHRGVYRCVIKNEVGVLTSKTVALKLNSKPLIVTQPENLVGVSGKAVTFSVVAGGTAPLKYQWFSVINDIPTELGKAAKQTVSKLSDNSEGEYYCVVTNAFGETTTTEASLRVDEPVVISTQPANTSVEVGGTLTLSISTSKGDGPISYQWQRNNKNLEDDDDITGAVVTVDGPEGLRESVLLRIENVEQADAGSYRCIVTNIDGAVKLTSKTAKVTVLTPPSIAPSGQPQDAGERFEGETVTFKVVATGSPKLTYQWQKAAADAPAGPYTDIARATSASLSLKLAIDPFGGNDMSGFYRCVVSNQTSVQAFSNGASLTVKEISPPVVTEITPQRGQRGDKVRVTGTGLQFVKDVKFGNVKGGLVKESDTSLLLTVPAIAADEPTPIILTNTVGGVTETSGENRFTRSETAVNDLENPRILTGLNFAPQFDELTDDFAVRAYSWKFEKPGLYNFGIAGTVATTVTFIAVTEDGTSSLTFPNPTNNTSIQALIDVFEPNLNVTIIVSRKSNVEGAFAMRVKYNQTNGGGSGFPDAADGGAAMAAVEPSSEDVAVTAGSVTENWETTGSTGLFKTDHSVPDADNSYSLTGSSSAGAEPTVLWKDTSALEYTESSVIRTEWTMSIDQVGSGPGGYFAWQVSGADGQPLGQLQFSVKDGAMFTAAGDGSRASLDSVLLPGSEHRFEIITDLASDTWQVRMDGVALGSPRPLPANAGFGDVSAIWYPVDGSGKPTMSFENVSVTVD